MQQIIVQPLLNNLMMIMAYLINIKTEARHCQNHKKDLTPTIQVKLCLNKIPLDNRYDNEYNDMNSQMMGIQNAVTARPGHARNSSASAGSVNVQPSVRPLSVYEKQEVFNDWGAVLKHQDEIDREIKRQQDDKFREHQKNYKLQLDMQYQEYLNKKNGSLNDIVKKEEEMLKVQRKTQDEKQRLEDEKRSNIINQQK